MIFRQEGRNVRGELRRRPLDRIRCAIIRAVEARDQLAAGEPRSPVAIADALEPRTLLSQTINLPLVNPGFDTLYKPGSTSITASIPNESATQGFGQDYPVENLNGDLNFAAVNYSDGTIGRTVSIPGWTVLPIEHFPKQRPVAGIVKDSVAYPGKTDNFASIFYTPDISNDSTQIRQTLIGTTLLPNSEYILSADVDEGGALNLEAGSTFLSTARIRSTAKDAAGFRRTTKTYMTHSTVPAGDITVVLGSGGSSDGDFDNVTLQLVSSGATPSPSPTPTPMPFGSFNGRNHNVKLTEPDGTIVNFSMSGGSGYATQDVNQIDLQINSASPKASVGITARLGSATFTLGNVTVSGSLNRLSAPAGTLSGAMSVSGAIGLLSLSSIGGQISAGSIGRIQAGAVTGVVYSAGSIGSVKLDAVSGTLDAAGVIGTVSATSLTGATVLSGVNLGAGGAAPVSPAAALSYGSGAISALSVSGSVTADTVVAVGANPVDGIFGNGNDTAAGAGQIISISIGGLADPNTRFEAPTFGRVKIHRAALTDLTGDPRFVTL